MAANIQDTIILFGDSLTELGSEAGGLVQRFSAVYKRKLDVLNRGFNGYNTRWALHVLPQILATKSEQPHVPKVRLLTIWLGANDAAIPSNVQHVPLSEYASNLTQLIRTVTDPSSAHHSTGTGVIVITPPPVNTVQWRAYKASKVPSEELDRLFETTREYAEKAREVAGGEGVVVVDVWTRIWKEAGEVEEGLSALLTDGLHLNERGYEIVFEEVISAIKVNFPELYYENLKETFSLFGEIDYANPGPSLQKRKIL
ncbi:SGNH hydrolase-type esterase domain-containing protein [Cristinia sonorae]|uniref:SGNH hydrolase-type esterase domain-containing protein n=1 Tax=Cristinia sonorae TaxID=1940300 RepID=A0A8K0XRZ2_9AGAR|nr:SGNH hydrolase-type esterase domain-containing protein [Cristinia sonorae]